MRVVWNSLIPTKVNFFVWTAIWNRILTIDNLKLRGWQISNRCYMCGAAEESMDHLLLHCVVAANIGYMGLALFGVKWVCPDSVGQAVHAWDIFGSHRRCSL